MMACFSFVVADATYTDQHISPRSQCVTNQCPLQEITNTQSTSGLQSRVTLDITDWQLQDTGHGMVLVADNGAMVVPPRMVESLIQQNNELLVSEYSKY